MTSEEDIVQSARMLKTGETIENASQSQLCLLTAGHLNGRANHGGCLSTVSKIKGIQYETRSGNLGDDRKLKLNECRTTFKDS